MIIFIYFTQNYFHHYMITAEFLSGCAWSGWLPTLSYFSRERAADFNKKYTRNGKRTITPLCRWGKFTHFIFLFVYLYYLHFVFFFSFCYITCFDETWLYTGSSCAYGCSFSISKCYTRPWKISSIQERGAHLYYLQFNMIFLVNPFFVL